MDTFASAVDAGAHAAAVCRRARMLRAHAQEARADAADLRIAIRSTLSRIRGKVICGGAGGPESEPIRSHIRHLIDTGQLPDHPPTMIWVGPSKGPRTCTACGEALAVGKIEYEVTVGTATVFLHMACVGLWAMEAERRLDVTAVIREKMAQGELPSTRSGPMWISNGRGESCSACERPISAVAVLYDFTEAGRRFHLHETCWRAWHEERGLLGLT